MSKNIAAGIDVGTHHVRVVVGARGKKAGKIVRRIIGTGIATSKGLRYGYIVNGPEATHSIGKALAQAEKTAGVKIRRAQLSLGGASLEGIPATGSVSISRADGQITERDVDLVLEAAEESLPQNVAQNKRIIHTIPVEYLIDGTEVLGQPVGMKGLKLEVKTLLVTCLSQHLADLVQAVEEVGVDVEDVVAEPLASAMVNLTKTQRVAGVVLANIGAETVSIVVYENNTPISLKIFPIGSTDITNDIALGLKIPLEEAEKIKKGENEDSAHSQKQLEQIIKARLTDILELIETHLKKIKKNGLLPAGIVLTGGGSGLASLEDLARAALAIPSKTAELSIASGKGIIRDPSWSVAYGLIVLALASPGDGESHQLGLRAARRTKDTLLGWIRQFLP